MKKVFLTMICALGLVGCGAHTPDFYAENTPKMEMTEFFNGKVDGWGVIYDWKGRVVKRFHILMDGKWQTRDGGQKVFRLDELFTFADGSTMERGWDIEKTGEDTFVGYAEESPEPAKGVQKGNAAKWNYHFDMPYNGKTIRLKMDDWMWLVDENTLVNRNKFYKFGLNVGEINIFFRKTPA